MTVSWRAEFLLLRHGFFIGEELHSWARSVPDKSKKKGREWVKKMQKKDSKSLIVYLLVLGISVIYILGGHQLAMTNYHAFDDDDQSIVVKATVLEITDRYSESYQISETEIAENETILFKAKIRSGADAGLFYGN